MFKKVLIANRGEIALRVIRACRELGIQTVAVYSEADRESLHVRFADDDVCIGPPPARDSYLKIPRIIAAAEITGADAIHPGYGFLAENAEFAETCAASNIAFIGPTAEQIRVMGDKAAARKAMAAVGVPIVPGTPGPIEDVDEALSFARDIGFPVIIKAAAGGGGKGMRVAEDPEVFMRAFQLARSEALSAFGSGDVYVEKYLARPRHIEFQIMGDKHGRVIHLGERDCSVQRRHQKLIEEAPSPAVGPALRERMGQDAVRGAKAIDYVGAGTIEMLLDEDGSYYFMEMNTRIQVEHGVTEMLTGVDLVKRIDVFHPPGGPGVRIDSHVYAGYTVPPFYDSLLAKLICQGRDRAEAVKRVQVALESFVLEGVTTTIPFLARVMQNAAFQAGQVDTKFLEREASLLREP